MPGRALGPVGHDAALGQIGDAGRRIAVAGAGLEQVGQRTALVVGNALQAPGPQCAVDGRAGGALDHLQQLRGRRPGRLQALARHRMPAADQRLHQRGQIGAALTQGFSVQGLGRRGARLWCPISSQRTGPEPSGHTARPAVMQCVRPQIGT